MVRGAATEGGRTAAGGREQSLPARGEAVPDAVAPPPRHRRFPLFDGLRAIAVAAIVVVHVTLFSGALDTGGLTGHVLARMNIGVAIFFLVSGFLLYRPFIAHRVGGASAPAVLEYAKRRFLRIYPAYWVVFTVLVILPGVGAVPDHGPFAGYALLHTLPIDTGGGCAGDCGLIQTWSLVVEVTFYAALPLYVLVANRLARGRAASTWMRNELIALVALATIATVAKFAIVDGGSPWMNGSVLGYVYWFALGMGLAVLSVGLEARRRQPALVSLVVERPLLPWAAAAASYLALSLWLPVILETAAQRLILTVAFGAIAALVLLPAVFGDGAGGLPRRVLANPVVAWVGLVSYGIFLWHLFFARELGEAGGGFFEVLAGTALASTACAAASYYLVERPTLRLKYRRLRDVVRLRRPEPAPVPSADVTQSGRL